MSTAAWSEVLDRLESDVAAAEDVLRAGLAVEETRAADWQAPHDLGPLPATLRERAERLLARQRRAELQMRHALEDAGRRRATVDSLGTAYAGHRSPVYVDVAV